MEHTKPDIVAGALVGALMTAPLMALFFVASRLIGTPLVPFDFFDWLARNLPGGVITLGIDSMVAVLRALGFSVSETAKTAEGIMALAIFLALGALAGGILFGLMGWLGRPREPGDPPGYVPGLLLGLVVAVPVLNAADAVIEEGLGLVNAVWLLIMFLAWGSAIDWTRRWLAGQAQAPVPSAAEDEEPTVEQISRRQFLLRLGGATAAITVVGAGLGLLLPERGEVATASGDEEGTGGPAPDEDTGGADPVRAEDLPNAGDPLEPAPGTRSEYTPVNKHYRIDINLRPPVINGPGWVLPITGMVANPLHLTIQNLRADYEPVSRYVTLACISNYVGGDLIGTTLWTGVPMQRILADAGLREGAQYLKITSKDGFWEVVSLEAINADERIMLCYEWDGRPLTISHGYPARIYIPDKYGMKQPKWITKMEVLDHYEEGYWVVRGWDEVARMNSTSVIDTVATDAIFEQDGRQMVPVGGIAHGGARGISKVEISVDGGEWVEARLRQPLSDLTWVIWRYDWPFEEGQHALWVRCTDGDGVLQEDRLADPHPSGATGLHSYEVSL